MDPASPFSEAGPFNEMVVMGVNAVRLQGLNKELEWDGESMTFTNISANDTIKTVIADGLVLVNGEVETRKRRKMLSGDVVKFAGEELKLKLC